MVKALRDALTHHPEFLDVWADMEAGKPEMAMDIELSTKANSIFANRATLEDDE